MQPLVFFKALMTFVFLRILEASIAGLTDDRLFLVAGMLWGAVFCYLKSSLEELKKSL